MSQASKRQQLEKYQVVPAIKINGHTVYCVTVTEPYSKLTKLEFIDQHPEAWLAMRSAALELIMEESTKPDTESYLELLLMLTRTLFDVEDEENGNFDMFEDFEGEEEVEKKEAEKEVIVVED